MLNMHVCRQLSRFFLVYGRPMKSTCVFSMGAHNTHSCIGQARAGGAYERAVSSSPLAGVPGSGRQRIRPAPTTHGHGHQAPSRERKAACPLVRAERSEGPQAGASLARPYVPATTSNGYVCVCVFCLTATRLAWLRSCFVRTRVWSGSLVLLRGVARYRSRPAHQQAGRVHDFTRAPLLARVRPRRPGGNRDECLFSFFLCTTTRGDDLSLL
jgi:hypothetical protein